MFQKPNEFAGFARRDRRRARFHGRHSRFVVSQPRRYSPADADSFTRPQPFQVRLEQNQMGASRVR